MKECKSKHLFLIMINLSLVLVARTEDNGLVVAGDGRASTVGHTAKYGTYSLLDTSRSQIASIKVVQVVIINFH